MTKIKNFTKGLLLATVLTVASLNVSANPLIDSNANSYAITDTNAAASAATNVATSEVFTNMVQTSSYHVLDVIHQALANELSALSDEISLEIATAVNQSMIDFGLVNADSVLAPKVIITDLNSSNQQEQ